ncbi:MFS transporter [Amycolatopsis sp. FDAARGOS 1241]|uniref:MFS transporter n=1 Tax=Amycolatopsis sp. FDAARGOS 1241 TaxID=2778070 RepID=UPI00194F7BBC|nr:MFS transporter [Amycolatopsis sp. FDAARGOS 1241]QRP49074.1 MFS transporter [Amycolatopsis sp. FDAARGOS 1241]
MTESAPDVRTELGAAPLRPFHWLLVGLVALATMFDGYDTLIPSYVIHFVAKPWHLSEGQVGFLVSSGLIGFAVGSVVHGVIADRIGRRPTLIAGLLVSGFFSVLTGAFGTSYTSFITLRALTGLGLGVLLPLGTAYVNEYLPNRVHHRLAVLGGTGFALGGVLAAVLGVSLTSGGNWQSLFYVGGGALVLGLIYLAVFPESVEYLVSHGRTPDALRLLGRIRPDRVAVYESRGLIAAEPPARDLKLVVSSRYRVRTIALWVSSFLLLFNVYGLSAWTPELMIERGHGFATGFGFGAVLQGTSIIGALLGGFVADRWLGARRSLMLWCALGVVAAIVIALAGGTAIDIIAIALAGLGIIGGQFLLNNVCAITYPVHARGTGAGLMLGFGRVGGIVGPTIGGSLLGAFGGTSALFFAVAIAAALAIVSTSFVTDRTSRTVGATEPQQGVPA